MERTVIKIESKNIYAFIDEPETEIKGILHFVHGMMESIEDYKEFSNYFTKHGYIVVLQEIMGHGKLAYDGKKGYMGPQGWNKAVNAIYSLYQKIRKNEKEIPYYLAGFSLGSFLIRETLIENKFDLKGVCLIGTGNKSAAELNIASMMAKSRVKKYGEDSMDGVVDDLMLENYNKKIKDSKSSYRWLFVSDDIQDSFDTGGYVSTPQLFYDFVVSMKKTRKDTGKLTNQPLLLVSGKEDPVTGNIEILEKQMKKMGCQNVKAISIDKKRHHILRDENKEYVYSLLLEWMNEYD